MVTPVFYMTRKRKFMTLKTKKTICLLIGVALIITIISAVSYAYFTASGIINKQDAQLSTATLSLRFADNDNGIDVKLGFGEKVTKKFLIENTGTAEASLSLDWKNLINTYLNGSLTYRLTYSDLEDGEYTEIIPTSNVPTSEIAITQTMAGELSVPVGETYYYNLEITLNNLEEIDQKDDFDAFFNTSFNVGQPLKYRYYTLSVNPNGGGWETFSETREYPLQNGDTMEIPNPTRRGYEFIRWKVIGVSSKLEDNLFTMGISNTNLEAIWKANTYNVTIDANGGEYGGEELFELDYDSTVNIATPKREGYTFTGWSASAGTIEGSSFTLNEESDVTLTANWTVNSYNYTVIHRQMNVTGDEYIEVSNDTVTTKAEYGSTVTPEVKEYEGFTSPSARALNIAVNEEENVVIYDYTRNRYTLTIDANGGNYSGETSVSLYYGATSEIQSPSREGHTFTNWNVSLGTLNETVFTMGAGNATLTAEYAVNNYKYIVYHKQMNVNGSGYTTVDADTDEGTASYGITINPPVKTYIGFTSPNVQNLFISAETTYPPVKNKVEYNYDRNKYTLTVNPNGGTYTGNRSVSMYYGEPHTLGTPTRTGYTFAGWTKTTSNDSTLSNSTVTMGSSATTVTANWTVNKYTYKVYHRQMNVNGSGYTVVSADTVTSTANYGSTVTPAVKTYTGFTSPSTKSIVISNDTTKNEIYYDYARNQYNLTINPNGGIYNSSTANTTVKVYYGATYTLATPTKTGYTNSWSKVSGAGSLSGSKYTMAAGIATVQANWTAKTFSVTFNPNGGTTSTKSKTVTYNSTYGTLPTPTYSGYEFLGWYTASSGGTKIITSTKVTITANQTLYAHWKKIDGSYTLANLKLTSNGVKAAGTFNTRATTDEGIFEMVDDYGTSYYFRGAAENNYVKFGKNASGKDMYWRIIRINGDGSLRIIYDGTQAWANGVNTTASVNDRVAMTGVRWNASLLNDAKCVGYMFGGGTNTLSTSKEQAQTNETDTNAKTQLSKWYKTNIVDSGYSSAVNDTLFCNDRSTPGKSATGFKDDTGLGYHTNPTAYGATARTGYWNAGTTTIAPSFKCPEKNDAFTVNDKIRGNGALTYPVGLITADEVTAAGGRSGMTNSNYYLYKGTYYWTFSPFSFYYNGGAHVFIVGASGELGEDNVNYTPAITPVINLSANYVKTLIGTGTATDPYRTS